MFRRLRLYDQQVIDDEVEPLCPKLVFLLHHADRSLARDAMSTRKELTKSVVHRLAPSSILVLRRGARLSVSKATESTNERRFYGLNGSGL